MYVDLIPTQLRQQQITHRLKTNCATRMQLEPASTLDGLRNERKSSSNYIGEMKDCYYYGYKSTQFNSYQLEKMEILILICMRDQLQFNCYAINSIGLTKKMNKIPVYDSFKPTQQALHLEPSSAFDNIREEHDDIMGSSASAQSQIIKTMRKEQESGSVMSNIPLLLEVRKNGIVGDNLIAKDMGISKWKIGKMIGGGGSGRVYKALNITTGMLSAVKKIHLCEEDEEQCKSQIAILSKIHHENIVRYLQHYHLEEQTWIFMEYVPGTLKNFYKDFGPPPYDTYLYFAKQLIAALGYLHKQKIVHKDLKCANILLTSKGVLKLTDFGCSKGFDQTLSLVNYEIQGSKTQKGTSYWMAPETIIEGIYTRKTDIWSLGCTLLELATGIMPWTEKKLDPHKIMLHIGQTQQLPYIPENLPELTQKLIKSCLNRDAEQRSSTEQLLTLLQGV